MGQDQKDWVWWILFVALSVLAGAVITYILILTGEGEDMRMESGDKVEESMDQDYRQS